MSVARKRTERGQTLIIAALFMAVVLGFTALAIDIGLFYEDRRHMQNSADAAALAGVAWLPAQPLTAIDKAREWAKNNGIRDDQITKIEVQSTNVPNDSLYVELDGEFGWLFGRAVGMTTSNVGAQAKAVVGSLGSNNTIMPWAILQGESTCLDGNGDAIYGSTCSVKVGADASLINGWYGALDFDGRGGGANEYRSNIIDGTTSSHYCIDGDTSGGCVSSVTIVDALDGNKTGPTDEGIDARIAAGGTGCDEDGNGIEDFDEVFILNTGPGPTYTVACADSPRLVIIPIVSYSDTPVQTVTIEGWSLAYLDTYFCVGSGNCQGNGHWEVQVQLVDAVYSQTSGFMAAYDPNGAVTIRRLVE